MRKNIFPFLTSIIFLSSEIYSQIPVNNYPYNHIDVIEYKIEIDLTESFEKKNNSLKGKVNILCKVDTSAIDEIYLDAISLIVDSVFVNEERVNFIVLEKNLVIPLSKNYSFGDTLNIHIFYIRHAQNTPGFYFRASALGYPEEDIAFTASWQTNTRYWLPCKDWPTDKAMVNMRVKVPKDIVVASNGKLIERINDNNHSIYVWRDNHPMATYVISISASKYVSVEKKISRFSNPSDSILITYYTYDSNSSEIITGLENVPKIIEYYSWRFTEFPFKYLNFVYVPGFVFSAMSNQTLIQLRFIPNSDDLFIMPHEIAHQWFGCFINPADWNLWMTEGLAWYSAHLYADFVLGNNHFMNLIRQSAMSALMQDSVSINDGDGSKLNVVLEMLRTTLGDSFYWHAFRFFLNTYGYGSTTVREFNDAVNLTTGKNYDWFFDEWFYKPGHPIYNISWKSEKIFDNYNVFLRIEQTQTRQDVFTMPLNITFLNENSDTTLKVFNNKRVQLFEFYLDSEPLNVIFDKDTLLLLKEVNYEDLNFTPEYSYSLKQNYPNPFNPTTIIKYSVGNSAFVSLKLYDILGGEVRTLVNEEKQPGIYGVQFDSNNLSSGIYFYKLLAGSFSETKKMLLLK